MYGGQCNGGYQQGPACDPASSARTQVATRATPGALARTNPPVAGASTAHTVAGASTAPTAAAFDSSGRVEFPIGLAGRPGTQQVCWSTRVPINSGPGPNNAPALTAYNRPPF